MGSERLRFTEKAGWGVGTLGSGAMIYLLNSFILFFLVQKLSIPAAVAGLLLFVTRFYDSFADVTIGRLSDRTESRFGRRRVWMLAGALLSACSTALVFSLRPQVSMPATAAIALLLLTTFYTGYTMFVVPSLAMPAEMTDDPAERSDLMSYRTFFVMASGLLGMSGGAWIVGTLGSGREAYAALGFIFAVIIGASMLTAVYATRRARRVARSGTAVPVLASLRAVWGNRPFILLCTSKFFLLTGTTFGGAVGLFFFKYIMQRDERSLGLFGLSSSLAALAAIPVWRLMMKHWPKKPLFAISLLGHAAITATWALATPHEPQFVFVSRACVLGAFSAGSLLLMLALLPETMEYDRLRGGEERAGMLAGLFGFVEKSAYAVSPLVAGLLMSVAGLVAGDVPRSAQPDAAIATIMICMSIIPAVLQGLALLTIWRYQLDAVSLQQLRSRTALVSAGAGTTC